MGHITGVTDAEEYVLSYAASLTSMHLLVADTISDESGDRITDGF